VTPDKIRVVSGDVGTFTTPLGNKVGISREGIGISPESDEGKIIQSIYDRQLQDKIANEKQQEKFWNTINNSNARTVAKEITKLDDLKKANVITVVKPDQAKFVENVEKITGEKVKDCGWFGEKCFFDNISKGIDDIGSGFDTFVIDEQKKQDDSWKWFNDGVRETQDNIANFFENEGIKQQETIEWIQGGIEEKQNEIDSGVTWIQGGIDEKFEEFEKGVNWVQGGIDEGLRSVGDSVESISKGTSEFFGDFVKSGQEFVSEVIDIPKDLKKGADDFNRNLLIIGAVGLGAVVLLGRK
jgi:hypothetical protein